MTANRSVGATAAAVTPAAPMPATGVPAAGATSPLLPLEPDLARTMQQSVDFMYRRFVDLVAASRGLTPQEVDRFAQGRAWSGEDALRLKLVDRLGGIDQAVAAAAKLAGLKAGGYRVVHLPRAGRPGLWSVVAPSVMLGPPSADAGPLAAVRAVAQALGAHDREVRDLVLLLRRAHPYGVFAYTPIAPPH